jgi:hypothetical protein
MISGADTDGTKDDTSLNVLAPRANEAADRTGRAHPRTAQRFGAGGSRHAVEKVSQERRWEMTSKRKLLTGDALLERAHKLGVSIDSDNVINNAGPAGGMQWIPASDYEIQRRVMEAERHIREHNLWIVAFVSMVIAVASAAAAWWAVLHPAPQINCPLPPSVNQSR